MLPRKIIPLIVFTVGALLLSSGLPPAAAANDPVRFASGTVEFTYYEVERNDSGFQVRFEPLCTTSGPVPVYDTRDSDGATLIPVDPNQVCRGKVSLGTLTAYIRSVMLLQRTPAPGESAEIDHKNYIAEIGVRDAEGRHFFQNAVQSVTTRDMGLRWLTMHVQSLRAGGIDLAALLLQAKRAGKRVIELPRTAREVWDPSAVTKRGVLAGLEFQDHSAQ